MVRPHQILNLFLEHRILFALLPDFAEFTKKSIINLTIKYIDIAAITQ